MAQSQRNAGDGSPRETGNFSRAEDRSTRSTNRHRSAAEEREIERARHRREAFRGRMEEGDEGQGEWESSARNW